jgi:hypothetical protein
VPDARDAQLAVARAALHRLSLIDEMAGMGQRDGDPELTARCHHAGGALETMDRLAAMPDGTPEGAQFPATWAGGHALIIEFSDEELLARCQCGEPLGTGTPATCLDVFGETWERHVMTRRAA